MNQSKILALVTTRFPFGHGETFLETEIEFLARSFDKIFIFPEIIANNERALPANVIVNKSFSEWSKKKRFRIGITLFSWNFYKLLFKEKKRVRSLKDFIWLLKFYSNQPVWNKVYLYNSNLFREIDLFYTYWFTASTRSLARLRDNRKLRFTIVSRAHRYDVYEGVPDTPSFWPDRKCTLESIDRVYAISDNAREYLMSKYGCFNALYVSRLGVFDKFRVAKASREGHFSIVSVSRMAYMKRVDFILDCIVEFSKRNPKLNIQWTHFGGGDQFTSLVKQANDLKIENLSVSFKGVVKNSEIYEYYSNSPVDVFMNLSNSEGIPVSIMEAQSFGIPAIATNVGGNSEIVTPKTGIIIKDIQSLEEVMLALGNVCEGCFDHEVVKEIWKNTYNADLNYSEFAKSLESLIEG